MPIKYDFKKNIEVCAFRNHIELSKLLQRSEKNVFLNNIWCELMQYIVNIANSYNILKNRNLITKSHQNEKQKQIFETYYNVFKKIKLKIQLTKIINQYISIFPNYLSIQVRKGSCDFNDYRNYINNNDILKYINLSKNLSKLHNVKRWFIASDCLSLKRQIIKESNNKAMIYLKDKVTRKIDDDKTAAIEMEILSKGDYFIITNQSSYGYVSMLKSGKCIEIDTNPDCINTIGYGTNNHIIQYFNKL